MGKALPYVLGIGMLMIFLSYTLSFMNCIVFLSMGIGITIGAVITCIIE